MFQILSLGTLVGCLAPIPGSLLQGLGRSDILSKLYIFEMPFYFGLLWLLVQHIGLTGVALAAVIRTLVETILLFVLSSRVARLPLFSLLNNDFWKSVVVVFGLNAASFIIFITSESLYVKFIFLIIILSVFFSSHGILYWIVPTKKF